MRLKDQKKPLLALGVYDPLSSIVADHAGADLLWLSSYSFCASQGIPDIGAIPLALQEGLISRIKAVARPPLIIDADNAFGSERHCALIANRLEKMGVAGICIEDKVHPKESSLYPSGQSLQAPDRFCNLLRIFRYQAPSLLLLARLEGLIYGESESLVVEKAQMCAGVGADYVVIHYASQNVDRLNRVVNRCKEIVRIGIIPTLYVDNLHSVDPASVSIIVFANQLLRASVAHSKKVAQILLTDPARAENIIEPISDLNSLVLPNVQSPNTNL